MAGGTSVALFFQGDLGDPMSRLRISDCAVTPVKGNIQAAVVSWPGIVPLFAFGLFLIGRCCGIRKISAGFLKGTGFCCVATILLVYVFRFIRMGQVI